MLDDVIAVLHFDAGTGADGRGLLGQLPEGIAAADLWQMRSEKPAMRKLQDRMAILLPLAGGAAWQAWIFAKVPPLNTLAALVETLRQEGPGYLARRVHPDRLTPSVAAPAPGPASDGETGTGDAQAALLLALSRLGEGKGRKPASVLLTLANACVEAGLCGFAAVAEQRGKRLCHLALSDQERLPYADEIRHVMQALCGAEPQTLRIGAEDTSAADLETVVLKDMIAEGDLVARIPGKGAYGFSILLFGAREGAEPAVAGLEAALTAVLPGRAPKPMRAQLLRAGLWASAAAVLVWLALPAPLRVVATAESRPAAARSLALPFDAFLQDMHVRVGDRVAEGQPIATLRAPSLRDQREEVSSQIAIEQVAAQTALSGNDYGAYVLAEQRIAQNEKRRGQLDRQLALLSVAAPEAGRVVQALGHDIEGAHQPVGQSIALLQPEARFHATLSVARIDAPLLAVGQGGDVWFRGIAGANWRLTLLSAPMLVTDPNSGQEDLVVQAALQGPDQAQLFAGLAGFARIDAGQQMRALVLSRYAREYLRTKLWTWFDWRL